MARRSFHALWVGVLLLSACGSEGDSALGRRPSTGTGGSAGSLGSGGRSNPASGGAAGTAAPCDSDRDCTPLGKLCDHSTGQCVRCLVDTDCPGGAVCRGGACETPITCQNSIDCVGAPDGRLICDRPASNCVQCVVDADCDSGSICRATRCVPQVGVGGASGTGGNVPVGGATSTGGAVIAGAPNTGGLSATGGAIGTTGGTGNGGRAAVGSPCVGFSDCESLSCVGGFCFPPTCDDGLVNGTEPVLDCGGPCLTCPVGGLCQAPGNCASGLCNASSQCDPAPTCSNGTRDGTETDVDCGGKSCARCKAGSMCAVPGDCLTRVCTAGRCANCSPRLCPDTGLGPACCASTGSCGYSVLGFVCTPRP